MIVSVRKAMTAAGVAREQVVDALDLVGRHADDGAGAKPADAQHGRRGREHGIGRRRLEDAGEVRGTAR